MNRIKTILALGLCSMSYSSLAMHDPSAKNDKITALVGQSITFNISRILSNDSDLDGDNLYLTVIDDADGGVVSADKVTGLITFTPNSSEPSEATFNYGIADSSSNVDDYAHMGFASVSISFSETTPINDTAPVAKNDTFIHASAEPLVISISDLFQNDYSLDNKPLHLVYLDDVENGLVSRDDNKGTITVARTDLNSNTTFNYGIAAVSGEDSSELIGFASVVVSSQTSVNEPSLGLGLGPIAQNEIITRNNIDNLIIPTSELLANDSDPENNSIYVAYVDDSRNGVAILNKEMGTISFTFNQGQTEGGFTYGVSDSATVNDYARMGYAQATIVIDENYTAPTDPVPEPMEPTAFNDSFDSGVQDITFTINHASLLSNDTNPDNGPMYIVDAAGAENGIVTLQENSVMFSPNEGFTGTATFDYYLANNQQANQTNSSKASVSITFTEPTTPTPPSSGSLPIAVNEHFIGTTNTTLVLNIANDLLANDLDADGDQLYLVAVDDWNNGEAAISTDGLSVTFKPSTNHIGSAVFYYQVSDIPNDTALTRISYGRVDLTFEGEVVTLPPENTRESNLACHAPTPTVAPDLASFQPAFPNLHISTVANDMVLAMVQPKNDSSFWFTSTRFGRVYQFSNNATANQATQVLDLSDKVLTNGEFGLTSIAFHPNYPTDNRLFAIYNDHPESGNVDRSVIASYRVDTQSLEVDRASEIIVFNMVQPGQVHNGGDLAFGLDGMLYASFGDSDYPTLAQNPSSLLGSIIRIDVSTTPYSIPDGNVYDDNTLPSCNGINFETNHNCPEIYAKGFRNPWRISIDSLTGDLWVGDVGDGGQSSYEEVNKIAVGSLSLERNFGWPILEGTDCKGSTCDNLNHQAPIAQYPHGGFASVVGGYVYRGTRSPELDGQYIFVDGYKNNVYIVPSEATATVNTTSQLSAISGAFAMAQGNDGEIYFLNNDAGEVGSNIYRIEATGGVSYNMPTLLSQTGCFDTANKTSPAGSIDYKVNAALWSDGEEKVRSFALPDNGQIQVLENGDYEFPQGSMLLKHFTIEDRYIETRILAYQQDGWAGYSYKWNDEGTDAVLLTDSETITDGDFSHTFPSRDQCGACHTDSANMPLGPEHAQLNYFDDTLEQNFISHLNNIGYFSEPQIAAEQAQLSAIEDSSASVEERARSYLHVNCAGCHQPGGAFADLDLRYSTPLADMNLCNVPATKTDIEGYIEGMQRLYLGEPNLSMLLFRMRALESNIRMPRLGTTKEHSLAVEVIGDWISTMPSCH